MSTDKDEVLEDLAAEYGIQPFYWDIAGVKQIASDQTKIGLLEAMGVPANTIADRERSFAHAKQRILAEVVPPVLVVEEGTPVRVKIRGRLSEVGFRIKLESGEQCSGQASLHGDGDTPTAELSEDLPAGYHLLELDLDGATLQTKLIICPARCHLPDSQPRSFGLAAQLYSLRSVENWGAGDFRDLRAAVPLVAATGADFIGLNPLHALFQGTGDNPSPYSPSSRFALNTIYITVENVPEYEECVPAQKLVRHTGFQSKLKFLRDAAEIDYAEVWRMKLEVLELVFETFLEKHRGKGTERDRAFERFLQEGGSSLELSVRYAVLREHLLKQSPALWGWPVWPPELQSPESIAVQELCRTLEKRIELFRYLQFIGDEQLQSVSDACASGGMRIGLYLDLALGANSGSAETWAYRDLFALDASMGAPPDELGPQGQKWGLPPFIPERLRAAGYQPFIEALRFSMRSAGALRIDHMMSLFRLFWIATGENASQGGYVHYPFEDLLGIVALESVRNQCIIIGEDLGTVPDEVREGMKRVGIFSYKVLYFMREGTAFVKAEQYPREALVVCSTHDLPTVWSFWEGLDIDIREELKVLPDERLYDRMRELRDEDRRGLIERLGDDGYIPEGYEPPEKLPLEWALAFHIFLARTPSLMQAIQLEDLAVQLEQVNLPGTVDEHPNWRRKLRVSIPELLEEQFAKKVVHAVAQERGRR